MHSAVFQTRTFLSCIIFFGISFLCFPLMGNAQQVSNTSQLINAIQNASAGDTITLKKGTFILKSSLKINKPITLKGAGIDKTIIKAANSWTPGYNNLPTDNKDNENENAYLITIKSGIDNITLHDMTLTGTKLHGGLLSLFNDNLHLFNLKVIDFNWAGLRIYNSKSFYFHDNIFVDAGGVHGWTGGGIYNRWCDNGEIAHNLFYRSSSNKSNKQRNYYGIKGYGGDRVYIHHNNIKTNFAIEYPHDNNNNVEIAYNLLHGTISIPKHAGGKALSSGLAFHIHHNWFKRTYSLEWSRNSVEVNHNLFDFSVTDDGGNLISLFGDQLSPGPTYFHDNLIKNPGRGIAWLKGNKSKAVYNNFYFYNNHVKANTTTRTSGFFDFHPNTTFNTIEIRDNIFQNTEENPRELLRNNASGAALIENNTLEHISDTHRYENPGTNAHRGPLEDLDFLLGVHDSHRVLQWELIDLSIEEETPPSEDPPTDVPPGDTPSDMPNDQTPEQEETPETPELPEQAPENPQNPDTPAPEAPQSPDSDEDRVSDQLVLLLETLKEHALQARKPMPSKSKIQRSSSKKQKRLKKKKKQIRKERKNVATVLEELEQLTSMHNNDVLSLETVQMLQKMSKEGKRKGKKGKKAWRDFMLLLESL